MIEGVEGSRPETSARAALAKRVLTGGARHADESRNRLIDLIFEERLRSYGCGTRASGLLEDRGGSDEALLRGRIDEVYSLRSTRQPE